MDTRRPIPVPPAFERVTDVVAGLADLEAAFLASGDRRGVFVTAYRVITRTIQDWIGRRLFLENESVGRYVVAFANGYRQALARYEAGDRSAVPEAWRQSFDASGTGTASVTQDLMLGINAHINHDLPYAVLGAGLDVNCPRCHHDHTLINEALRSATPCVRRRIAGFYRRGLHVINWVCGRAIDGQAARCFQRARRNSWSLAHALAAARGAAERARVETVISDRAALAGRVILSHARRPAKCLAILHEVEDFIACPGQELTRSPSTG
jgi:hypothetical protein